MVDPINFTNYDRTEIELQETVLFSLLVAGKNAVTTSKLLNRLLRDFSHIGDTPFEILSHFELDRLPSLSRVLKDYGFGCYTIKAKGVYQLIRAGLNLRKCSVVDLEAIHSIGPKTARLFVLHTRPDANCIPLDVHILRHLRDLGYDVPKMTPSSKKQYANIENVCVNLARKAGKTCADWDLDIWKIYREKAIDRKRKVS